MAINIKVLEEEEEFTGSAKSVTLNLLPCSIQHCGPANVSSYFVVKEDPATHIWDSSFRGRELKGNKVTIPPNYTGLILRQSNNDTFHISGSFDNFIHWGHDQV